MARMGLRDAGFLPIQGFDADLLTLPLPDKRERLEAEQRRTRQATAQWCDPHKRARGALTGPWIEIVYRLDW